MRHPFICFDLFNTLVNVGQVPAAVGRLTADILGIDREQWNAACFGPYHNICEPTDALQTLQRLAHSIDPGIPCARIEQAVQERQQRFDHALCHPAAEVVEALEGLCARGHRLALVSNASTAEVQAWPRSPLCGFFEVSIFSCECGAQKPHAPIYEAAMTQLQARGHQCLFVGDGGSDEHRGAATVGMTTVLLTTHLREERRARIVQRQGEAIAHELSSIDRLWKLIDVLGRGGGTDAATPGVSPHR